MQISPGGILSRLQHCKSNALPRLPGVFYLGGIMVKELKILERTKNLFDFIFARLFDDRQITQEDRNDHCAGENDGEGEEENETDN